VDIIRQDTTMKAPEGMLFDFEEDCKKASKL